MDNIELIQQARGLCSEATDAPWKIYNTPDYTEIHVQGGRNAGFSPVALADKIYNASFIAASRTLVPQLCDALEAAEKEIEQLSFDYDEANRAYHEWFEEAQEAIARAEKAEAENRWIPVRERPPENGYALAYCSSGNRASTFFWNGKSKDLEELGYVVTHWRPLPAPPKEAAP